MTLDENPDLDSWFTITRNGRRRWYATDAVHAIEQHRLAFEDDDTEDIIGVALVEELTTLIDILVDPLTEE